ncbi:MAG: hypothetical protein JO021_18970 [Alphaproteobacteria bacterium]|nr:hypothetical protein [Alphaproteobacteria bacterium]
MARSLDRAEVDGALGRLETLLTGELGRRRLAPDASDAPAAHSLGDRRFAGSADSPPSKAALTRLEAALIATIAAALPRLASDALHGALNQALDGLRLAAAASPAP